MKKRICWHLAALALLMAASGCAGRLVKVKGKLTWKGQPVPNTQVKFLPDDGTRPGVGHTNDSGEFTLKYSRDEVGATRGRCTVILEYVPSNEEELGQIPPKASPELKAALRGYRDPKSSPLHCEITHNGQFFDLKVE